MTTRFRTLPISAEIVAPSRFRTVLMSRIMIRFLPEELEVQKQNTSHAVMAQRIEANDSPDDFPTPPWATRALIEHVLEGKEGLKSQSCLEPACGAGHMAKVLNEYFGDVSASDAYSYDYGSVRDFLEVPYEENSVDWVITNPPFRLAEEFILQSLRIARHGVAILARTVFLESVGRYDSLFSINPPTKFAQFVERVPMVRGRLDQKASTATGYAWFVWEKRTKNESRLLWVPPCRKRLERSGDYALPSPRVPEVTEFSSSWKRDLFRE